MASFDALLEAAQFLEHRNTPGTKTRAAADNKNFHAYSKNASQQENKTNGKGEPSAKASSEKKGSDDEDQPIVRRPGGHGTREVHNKLEKNRRAHLKECFENLRLQIPHMEDKKTSNLAILRAAQRHIHSLRKKEKDLEMYTQNLAREKICMQTRIVALKEELVALNVDVDLDSFIKSIQDDDGHSQSTATADGDAPILSDVEEDMNADPAMCVTVEAQPYSPTQTSTILNTSNVGGNLTFFGLPQSSSSSNSFSHQPVFKKVTFGGTSSAAAGTGNNTSTIQATPTNLLSVNPMSSILATAAEAAQIKVVSNNTSSSHRPNALSITNPSASGGPSLITLNPNNTISGTGGGNKPLTLFATVTAGQNAGTPSAPLVVAPPTNTRTPVTQILQQQLAQRALVKQQQNPTVILQPTAASGSASAIPHMITVSPQQFRNLTSGSLQTSHQVTSSSQQQLQHSTGSTSQAQTITLQQLPFLRLPQAPQRAPPTAPAAITLQQLLAQLQGAGATAGSNMFTVQPNGTLSVSAASSQGTNFNYLQSAPARSVTTTSSISSTPTIFSLQPAQTQQQNANTILSPTTYNIQTAPIMTTTSSGAATSTVSSPLKLTSALHTSTGQPFTLTNVPRPANTVQIPTAQILTQQQLQQLILQQTLNNQNHHKNASVVVTTASSNHNPAAQVVLQAANTQPQAIATPLPPATTTTHAANNVIYQISPASAANTAPSHSGNNVIYQISQPSTSNTTTTHSAANNVIYQLSQASQASNTTTTQAGNNVIYQIPQYSQASASNTSSTSHAGNSVIYQIPQSSQSSNATTTQAGNSVIYQLPQSSQSSNATTTQAGNSVIYQIPQSSQSSNATTTQAGNSVIYQIPQSSQSSNATTTQAGNSVIYQIPQIQQSSGSNSIQTLSQAQLQALVKQLSAGQQQLTLPSVSPVVMVSLPSLMNQAGGHGTVSSGGQQQLPQQQGTTTIQLVAASPNSTVTTTRPS